MPITVWQACLAMMMRILHLHYVSIFALYQDMDIF